MQPVTDFDDVLGQTGIRTCRRCSSRKAQRAAECVRRSLLPTTYQSIQTDFTSANEMCDRCPRRECATFQVKDQFNQDARMLCRCCAQSAVQELSGSTLRPLVPLAHLTWAQDIVEALLVHLFTRAPALPDRDSRVELATNLFWSLGAGNVPELAVPLPNQSGAKTQYTDDRSCRPGKRQRMPASC